MPTDDEEDTDFRDSITKFEQFAADLGLPASPMEPWSPEPQEADDDVDAAAR